MKKFSLLVVCLGLLSRVLGQTICLSEKEVQAQRKQLDSTYASEGKLFPQLFEKQLQLGGYLALGPEERRYRAAGGKLDKALRAYLQQSGFSESKQTGLVLHLFVRPDGSIALASSRLIDGLSTPRIDSLQALLCPWLSTYRYAYTTTRPFQTRVYCILGSKETAKAKPGTIVALDQLATTRPDTVTKCFLGMNELTEVPPQIFGFTNLTELNLMGNELTALPEALFTLKKLKRLDLSGNRLTAEAIRIPRNKHLDFLNLQYNQLTSLPRSITNNRRLTSLWLGHNDLSAGLDHRVLKRLRRLQDINLYNVHLTSLPAAIGRLKRLQILDLYYNQLQTLPKQMGRLRRLQQLAISQNKLGTLPQSLSRLRHLERLYAHHNFLASLPKGLEKLHRLTLIDVGHNAFSFVPPELISIPRLEEVDLSNNQLTSLPADLTQMRTLKKLFVRSNPVSEAKKVTASLPVIKQLEDNLTEVFY